MMALPRIMVAPNGARLTRADHPALPVTIPQIVECAMECQAAGADGLHAHVRDADQRHVLDAGLYRELLDELALKAPRLYVQITTEAVGRFSPAQQRDLVARVVPPAVSVALREITTEPDATVTRRFFAFCQEAGIAVQHILYDQADVKLLGSLLADGTIARDGLAALLVLGRYAKDQVSEPADLDAPLGALRGLGVPVDWAICAFGPHETDCLIHADALGGKMRIGFENNRTNADGTLARSNAERVLELVARLPRSASRAS
jgi:uncharacterized protein (DUF849 family)